MAGWKCRGMEWVVLAVLGVLWTTWEGDGAVASTIRSSVVGLMRFRCADGQMARNKVRRVFRRWGKKLRRGKRKAFIRFWFFFPDFSVHVYF